MVALLGIALLLCYFIFGDVLVNPGGFLLESSFDGLKNYFSVVYQLVHGSGQHFNGMLYPFGDALIFADGQPVLTALLRVISNPSDPDSIIASMNFIMLISPVICSLFIYLILKECKVGAVYAIVFALIIAFLNPQLERLNGHYALTYSFFIPMIWYMVLKIANGHRIWFWTILATALSTLFAINQPYYLLLSSSLVGSILLWQLIQPLILNNKRRAGILQMLILVVVPVALMFLYMNSVNHFADRPLKPYGIGVYDASFSGTFIPTNGPMSTLAREYFFTSFKYPEWESKAFVGLPATFFLLVFLVRSIRRVWTKGTQAVRMGLAANPVDISLVPALMVLVIASGELHNLGLDKLYHLVPQLEQFRSLGRLAWVFYYIFTVSAAVYFYLTFKYLRQIGGGKLRVHALVMVSVIGLIWISDAASNVKSVSTGIADYPRGSHRLSLEYAARLDSLGINVEDYQAILPLPFSLVGSEKLGLSNGPWASSHSMDVSVATGLPLFGGHMSRSSWQSTEKQAQLVGHPILPKPIHSELKQDKYILVLWSYENLSLGEKAVRDLGKKLWNNKRFELFRIKPQDLLKVNSNFVSTLKDLNPHLVEQPEDSDAIFRSVAVHQNQGDKFYESLLTVDTTKKEFEFSYWTLASDPEHEPVRAKLFWKDQDGLTHEAAIEPRASADVWRGWIRVSLNLELHSGENQIWVISETLSGLATQIHQMEVGDTSISANNQLWNNYPIEL